MDGGQRLGFYGGWNRRVAHALRQVDTAVALALHAHSANFGLDHAGRQVAEAQTRGGDIEVDGEVGFFDHCTTGKGRPLETILQGGMERARLGSWFPDLSLEIGSKTSGSSELNHQRVGIPARKIGLSGSPMHELSIVASIVETVTESLAAYPGARVQEVRLRVGALASVIEDSLQFCYGIATEGTLLAGSTLVVNTLPVLVHCEACGKDGELESLQSFQCPHCGEPATDVRQGRELEIESVEIEDPEEVGK